MRDPAERLDMIMDLGRAGFIDAETAWLVLWTPVDGQPVPPMPPEFPAAWAGIVAEPWDDITE